VRSRTPVVGCKAPHSVLRQRKKAKTQAMNYYFSMHDEIKSEIKKQQNK